ncbi:MAG: hypothetical protein HGA87_00480 [Desulfobulbaceae bacterium]|nr:hypothetical protein [Desulfobulbaceae bacterium]
MQILYHYDESGHFTGKSSAHLDQLETKLAGHDVFIFVPNSTETAPPEPQEEKLIKWVGSEWTLEDIPAPPEPEIQPEPTSEEVIAGIKAQRLSAYTVEADPIAMKMLRGEATEAEWLEKITEIRARYPYPVQS